MGKYFLLASSNIKKSKSQMITILAIVFIASMFLNLWLVLAIDYSQNYEAKSLELNSEQTLVCFSENDASFIETCEEILNSSDDALGYEIIDNVAGPITIKYSVATISSYISFLRLSDAKAKKIGKYDFLQSTENVDQNAVFLPYLFETGGGYNIGDDFEVEIDKIKYNFVVGGFFENMMSGSMNGGIVSVLLSDSKFSDMQQNSTSNGLNISVKLKDGVDDKKFTSKFVEDVSKQRLVPYYSIWHSINKQARTFISGIIGGIIALVAFFVIIIALIVIAFNINNKISEEMQSLGVLKGLGYKSKQIMLSILLQFLLVTLLGTILGIAVSYAVIPFIASMMVMQTGIIWSYEFCIVSALTCLLVIGLFVSLMSILSSLEIKKITPMTALRVGIETHNFKRNVVPLENTRLRVNTALSIKRIAKNTKQNIAISIILIVLTFIGVLASTLYDNVAVNPEMFIEMIAGENTDIAVLVKRDDASDILNMLEGKDNVEKTYEYTSNTVYYDDTDIMCNITKDFNDVSNKKMCYDGRFPKHDNEVAVGGYFAKINNLKIGDTVNLRFNKSESEYLITGFVQSSNQMGLDCMMTSAGFNKIGDLLFVTYFVNVKDGVEASSVIDEMQNAFSEKIISIIDVEKSTAGSAQVYISMMSIISFAAIAILLVVIFLVLYLMVKSFILKKRKEFGILKALGYTTKQLMCQTVLSFLPTAIVGVLLGCVVGVFVVNPTFTLFLSNIGIMKSMFTIPPIAVMIVGFGIVLFATLVTLLVSQKIRKISAYKMLVNE